MNAISRSPLSSPSILQHATFAIPHITSDISKIASRAANRAAARYAHHHAPVPSSPLSSNGHFQPLPRHSEGRLSRHTTTPSTCSVTPQFPAMSPIIDSLPPNRRKRAPSFTLAPSPRLLSPRPRRMSVSFAETTVLETKLFEERYGRMTMTDGVVKREDMAEMTARSYGFTYSPAIPLPTRELEYDFLVERLPEDLC